jgi:hypothetical protein
MLFRFYALVLFMNQKQAMAFLIICFGILGSFVASPHLAQAKHSSSGACYNIGDAGAEWLRGYHAGQAAEKGNSPGFSNANSADFQSGFDQVFADSKRGVNGPFC